MNGGPKIGVDSWTRETWPGALNSGWPGSRSNQKHVFEKGLRLEFAEEGFVLEVGFAACRGEVEVR